MTDKWEYSVSDEKLEELIKNYCTDFTQLERQGRYDPITGRDEEIENCILILLQKGRKNICFLASAGVGKTAAVVGLAQKIVSEDVPDYLIGARILEIDLARMASGTNSRAEFQDRFLPLCKAAAERYHNPDNPRIILFLDEIHQIMPSCISSSYAGLSDTMKPYLTAGDLLVIGATTLDEYREHMSKDSAMDRRFQKVFLDPPNIPETYAILKAIRQGFEKHHSLTIPNEILMLTVCLTEKYMRKRNQPDKSIITMDAAMAHHVMTKGINQELDVDAIYNAIACDVGMNAKAMHDDRLIEDVRKKVAIIEGDIKIDKKPKKENTKKQIFGSSEEIKNIEMDKDFQDELVNKGSESKLKQQQ